MSTVTIENVGKSYGPVAALKDISLSIRDGEFFGLLGPSGGGKTTLLRSIAGFVQPTRGRILIDDKPVQDTPVHRRNIGMMFQNYALFPHLTVAENIGYGLSVRGESKAAINQRVEELLALVKLEAYGGRKPRELSGGQQQRIALARAISTKPRVLLLDEPLGALDKRLRQHMQAELKEIQRTVGITTVFVTHDQEEALTLSDRIAILNEGGLVQVGTPRDVYEKPANRFAANFLGDANFFEGSVEKGKVRLADGTLISVAELGKAHGVIHFAVRPEKIRLTAQTAEKTATNRLEGRITQEMYAGNSILYRVACGTREVQVQHNPVAGVFAIGVAVELSFDPGHAVVVGES